MVKPVGFPGAGPICEGRAGWNIRPGNRVIAGGVAEWLKAADCKSVDVRLRRFESYPLHHRLKTQKWELRAGTGDGCRTRQCRQRLFEPAGRRANRKIIGRV